MACAREKRGFSGANSKATEKYKGHSAFLIKPMYIPRQLSLALVLVAVLVSAPCFGTSAQIVPLDQHERATRLITHFLDKYHYKDFSIDDLLSEQIMDAYVGALDPNRSY